MFDSSVARPVAGRLIPRGDFEALGLLRADGKYGIISSISRTAGSSGCGGKSSRGWREAILVTFSFQSMGKVLSIFVDESGRFQFPEGDQMTTSEMRLFGGPRDFKRNILKKIKTKEI